MIRCFATLSLALSLCSPSMAQPYVPLLADSNSWHTTYRQFSTYQTDFFFASEDTVFNLLTYKTIDLFHFNKRAFLREDTAIRKVFLRLLSGFKAEEDVLIYDFGLNVGDSVLMYNPNSTVPDSAWYVLDSIGAEKLADSSLTRLFHLSHTPSGKRTEWLEGVGSRSLITTPLVLGDSEEDILLSCLHKNEDLIFQSGLSQQSGTCDIETVGMDENTKQPFSFDVFPNPFEELLTITFSLPVSGYISLSDVWGCTHWSAVLVNCSEKSAGISGHLPGGLYVLSISDGHDRYTRKIVRRK